MPPRNSQDPVIRIHRRADGKYETRNENASDSPLGVDLTLGMAIGTATREASLASRQGHRVVIEVQQPDGNWKRVDVLNPPYG